MREDLRNGGDTTYEAMICVKMGEQEYVNGKYNAKVGT